MVKPEFYNFDTSMDFFHGAVNFEDDFLQIYPNPVIINDVKPGLLFNIYGIESDSYKRLTISITQGKAYLVRRFDTNPFGQYEEAIFSFTSDKGEITFSDSHDTFKYQWEKVDDKSYKLTNFDGVQIFWNGVKAEPVDLASYQQSIIDLYNFDTPEIIKQFVDEEFLLEHKARLFKKLLDSKKEHN